VAIDALEAVRVGGMTQWIRVRGRDASNPVLLLIPLGPGVPIINEARRFEQDVGVCQVDEAHDDEHHNRHLEQDARLRLLAALRRESEIHDLASYIYRVAASATIDAIRRLKARREEQLDPGGDGEPGLELPVEAAGSGERALERRRLLEKVEAVVDGLEARRGQVVRLHAQGFTTVEMARLMGTTEPAARNLLHRALKELRQRLRERGLTYAGD